MSLSYKGRRYKGAQYERDIAKIVRAAIPGADCHRSSQADRAHNSDIVVEGHPAMERLWLELEHTRSPSPRRKLEQAERDMAVKRASHRIAVVVWKRHGEQRSYVTMRITALLELIGRVGRGDALVTLELGEFLELVA